MDIKKAYNFTNKLVIPVIILMIVVAWYLAKAYEAPRYQVIDTCDKEWTYVHVGEDGFLEKSVMKLAWDNEEAFSSTLVLYDPVHNTVSSLTEEQQKTYTQEVDGPKYSFIRRSFWIPFLIFAVILMFFAFLLTSWISDIVTLLIVLKTKSFDDASYFLSQTHFLGVKKVQEIYRSKLRNYISRKEPELRHKYNEIFVAFLITMLNQMATSKDGVVYYLRIKDNTTKDQKTFLRNLRATLMERINSMPQAADLIRQVDKELQYNFVPIEIKTKPDQIKSDVKIAVEKSLHEIFTDIYSQEIVNFHTFDGSTILIPNIAKNTLYVDVTLDNEVGYFTFSDYKIPNINITVEIYILDDLLRHMTIFKGMLKKNCTYSGKVEDYKTTDFYSNVLAESLKNITTTWRSK